MNIRAETIELQKQNIGSKLLDIGLWDYFLNLIPKARVIRVKINKLGLLQSKKLLSNKTKNKIKRQITEWVKLFSNHIFDKELISKIRKEFIQLNNKNLKIGRGAKQTFSKEYIQVANRHIKRCPASLIIREMQIKIMVWPHIH